MCSSFPSSGEETDNQALLACKTFMKKIQADNKKVGGARISTVSYIKIFRVFTRNNYMHVLCEY
jgi:vesicle coat complex subunit